MKWRKIGDFALEALTDAGIWAALKVFFQKFSEEAAAHGAQKTAKAMFDDERGCLVRDFLQMPVGAKEKLLRRYQRTIKNCTEDQFVSLLCKLPKDQNGSRLDLLQKLNDATHSEFRAYMYMLENDGLYQKVRRAAYVVHGWSKPLRSKIVSAAQSIDTDAETLSGQFADWAESLPGATPRSRRKP